MIPRCKHVLDVFGENFHGSFNWDLGIRAMDVVQVDVVGLETFEGGGELFVDELRVTMDLHLGEHQSEFGSQEDFVAVSST